jgi:glutathione S-transferase
MAEIISHDFIYRTDGKRPDEQIECANREVPHGREVRVQRGPGLDFIVPTKHKRTSPANDRRAAAVCRFSQAGTVRLSLEPNKGAAMQLIGMLDSPYVRRVAVSLQFLGLPFEHRSVSVFSTFEQFQQINPVVKAPSLVCDDGEVLMDSTLILEYAEALAGARKSLLPGSIAERQHALRVIGLALAACEKSVQIVYERNLRPPEKLHEPWVARVTGQLLAAYEALESELRRRSLAVTSSTITQAGISTAVAWHFTQQMLPEVIPAANYPTLRAFSSTAELLPEFMRAPHGSDTYPHAG